MSGAVFNWRVLNEHLADLAEAPPDWPALFAMQRDGDLPLTCRFGVEMEDLARWLPPGQAYLASPYSLEAVDAEGNFERWRSWRAASQASRVQHALMAHGITAVSPIVQADAMVFAGPEVDPLDDGLWHRWCRPMMNASRAVIVSDQPGWHRSRGVWAEAIWAIRHSVHLAVLAGEVPE